MKHIGLKQYVIVLIVSSLFCGCAFAQFIDDFNGDSIAKDSKAIKGWGYFTGDGSAKIDFVQKEGYASIVVDASKDTRGIWWAVIKHCVSAEMNLAQLSQPDYELRIEAQIKVSHAPRRVNMSLNTQRTTDFHSNLMEFDIPDTNNWHTISFTTKDFDGLPGDTVFGQLAMMDWGLGKYKVDVNYFRVDIVNAATAGPDKGVSIPYRPTVADPNTFANKIKAIQDSTIDTEYPQMCFNDWCSQDNGEKTTLLNVNGTQLVIIRWDLSEFAGKKIDGGGLLELTTYSVESRAEKTKDFGEIRVTEILGGDPNWNQQNVTYDSFCKGQPIDNVLNSQMIIDTVANELRNGKTLITISNPVLQRMLDGRTLGLAIRPLGAINASFYAMENQDDKFSARLYFNVRR